MKRLLILPAALLAMSTIAACGDDDESSDDTSAITVRDTTAETTEDIGADTTRDTTEDTTGETGGSTATAATSGGSGSAGEVCDALEVISDYDEQSSQVLAGGGDHEQVLALFEEATPTVLSAYDDVAAAEPELADAASALSEFTQAAAGAAEGTTNLGELATAILELPNVSEAAEAGMELNTYAEENCGFSTGNQSG